VEALSKENWRQHSFNSKKQISINPMLVNRKRSIEGSMVFCYLNMELLKGFVSFQNVRIKEYDV